MTAWLRQPPMTLTHYGPHRFPVSWPAQDGHSRFYSASSSEKSWVAGLRRPGHGKAVRIGEKLALMPVAIVAT